METAKLFQNGRSQAVRLPKAYRFSGERVLIKRFGKGIVLLPDEDSWESLIESTAKFSTDFMETRDQGGEQEREGLLRVKYLLDTAWSFRHPDRRPWPES